MRVLPVLLACLLLAACSGVEIKPGEKPHARRDIPPGPGVLTGEQGEFVIFRVRDDAPAEEPEEEKVETE